MRACRYVHSYIPRGCHGIFLSWSALERESPDLELTCTTGCLAGNPSVLPACLSPAMGLAIDSFSWSPGTHGQVCKTEYKNFSNWGTSSHTVSPYIFFKRMAPARNLQKLYKNHFSRPSLDTKYTSVCKFTSLLGKRKIDSTNKGLLV